MEDFITIELGSSFLINAGILGFLKFLRHNDAEENVDFIIKGQYLYVSKSYILEKDISNMYVDTIAGIFEKETKLYNLISKNDYISSLISDEITKDAEKIIKNYFSEFAKTIEKNSFKAAYIIAENYENIISLSDDKIKDFKQEIELKSKFEKYCEILKIIKQIRLYNILLFKEIMYSKINIFFENTSFFLPKNLKTPIENHYKDDFYEPLENSVLSENQKKKRCIECSELSIQTRSISFMIDTTDDVARKKSYYWNCNPDAYVCEKCAFLYTFVPLGFAFLGQDAVFINNNRSIATLEKMMNTYEVKKETEINGKSRFYKSFIDLKSQILENKLHNIQVIIRNNKKNHYQFNIIDKEMIEKLSESALYLDRLEKKFVKDNEEFINVYDEVFDNILNKRIQYPLFNKLFKIALKENSNTNYLWYILIINIIFKGGSQLENLKKNVDIAFNSGKEMRGKLADGMKNVDIDNSLRGFVYKLSNAVSVNNRDQFIDSVIRVYSGKGLPMPYIFKECFNSDEMFKAIGQGFILGLKYTKYEKENKADE